MPQEKIRTMLGISDDDPCRDVGLFNHAWDNPAELATIGILTAAETREISDGVLAMEVPVQINRRIHDYDVALVVGPVFPHEVVGFSGGNKYFFPGISGPELLNFFHWLGTHYECGDHRCAGYGRASSGGSSCEIGAVGTSLFGVRRVHGCDTIWDVLWNTGRSLAWSFRAVGSRAYQAARKILSTGLVMRRPCTMNCGLLVSACTSWSLLSRTVAN